MLSNFKKGPKPSVKYAEKVTFDEMFDCNYWQSLCPNLHLNGTLPLIKSARKPESLVKEVSRQVLSEGVVHVRSDDLQLRADFRALVDGIEAIIAGGWVPSMVLLFDEVWSLVHQISGVMHGGCGNACNMDILAWHVDPNRDECGFSPHRDRQPDDSPSTFRADGSAKYTTAWVPLTRAVPENSCLYVIPRWADPGYFEGDPEDDDAPDPLQAALPRKESYQHIRALPADPGSALIFTHRIIHWGSKGRKGHPEPRVSISWGCADDSYEPSYFSREHLPYPPMDLRLALVAGQMIAYHERFPVSKRMLLKFHRLFSAKADEFHPSFRDKVWCEFVGAMKEKTDSAMRSQPGSSDPVPAAHSDNQLGRVRKSRQEIGANEKEAEQAEEEKEKEETGALNGQHRRAEVEANLSKDSRSAPKTPSGKIGDADTEEPPREASASVATKSKRRATADVGASEEDAGETTKPSGPKRRKKSKKVKSQSDGKDAERGDVESSARPESPKGDPSSAAPVQEDEGGEAHLEAALLGAGTNSGDLDVVDGCDTDDDLLDASLEAMLFAKMAGGDFDDDFADVDLADGFVSGELVKGLGFEGEDDDEEEEEEEEFTGFDFKPERKPVPMSLGALVPGFKKKKKSKGASNGKGNDTKGGHGTSAERTNPVGREVRARVRGGKRL